MNVPSAPAGIEDRFVEYYARESSTAATVARFRGIQQLAERLIARRGRAGEPLDVLDVGCGAAVQSMLWAEKGHRVSGVDISEGLVNLGRERVAQRGLPVELVVGDAARLPWPDARFDVCILLELLEHVVDWRRCLDEVMRVVRPGGVLALTTTNRLCPVQSEFALPLYSWYPGWLKRRCERMAVTTHPHWVSHAKYPAVNWFTFYELRGIVGERGWSAYDRFDLTDTPGASAPGRLALNAIRASAATRWLAHAATPYSLILAVRQQGGGHAA